jgi:hypothetical protein
MKARGFGIDFRNRGGVYFPHGYVEIRKVEVEYLDESNADLVDLCVGQPSGPLATRYYRRWRVKADTSEGPLEYTAVREWPPASIGRSMIYYHFSYQGTFRGGPITGRGYGEYVHI